MMMKTFAGITFLILLLGNVLGLSIARMFTESEFRTAEKIPSESNGFYRLDDQLYNIIEQVDANDTLYVTVPTNESAWQRFAVLSEILLEAHSSDKIDNPLSHALKLLNDLIKLYLPVKSLVHECDTDFMERSANTHYGDLSHAFRSEILLLDSPPPENM